MHLNKMLLSYSKQTLTPWLTTFVSMMTESCMLNMDTFLHDNVLTYCSGLSCVPALSQVTFSCNNGMNKEPALGIHLQTLIYVWNLLAWFLIRGQEVSMLFLLYLDILFLMTLWHFIILLYFTFFFMFAKWSNSENANEETSVCLKVCWKWRVKIIFQNLGFFLIQKVKCNFNHCPATNGWSFRNGGCLLCLCALEFLRSRQTLLLFLKLKQLGHGVAHLIWLKILSFPAYTYLKSVSVKDIIL